MGIYAGLANQINLISGAESLGTTYLGGQRQQDNISCGAGGQIFIKADFFSWTISACQDLARGCVGDENSLYGWLGFESTDAVGRNRESAASGDGVAAPRSRCLVHQRAIIAHAVSAGALQSDHELPRS